ncbi:MAG TPA: response regulator [Aggregatilinea sp.]|jgi:pilus assembly protein CpaE|uniref:AAA family ATPase n=1 Tax=Aggregatilinea sp. TaxID=2806333 RepID=UPI002B95404B|nr:response regulator [Aggregatilinea sp.]HML20048.1 response regulator [Aggregatilinea sp.]
MTSGSQKQVIKVLIVDDIPDVRDNLRKLLAFEPDIEVVGAAGTGREAIQIATEMRPDVVLMDINMPDMDGITATKSISTAVRTAAVVIVSVQSEPGYLRQAMLAGARDFLTKPIASEELYTTIRRVYERNEPVRQQEAQLAVAGRTTKGEVPKKVAAAARAAGHIIVVYSPQGGVGTTTIATNLASALMRPDTRVLLVDCALQFGDVDAFLNLQSTANISKLTQSVNDLDADVIENVVITHGSGLKVITAPSHPEQAYDITSDEIKDLMLMLGTLYDYIIVDTPTQYDDMTLKLFEVAERIVMVANPTIPSIRNSRKMIDILDVAERPDKLSDKVIFVLNRVVNEKERGHGTVPIASIENHVKRKVTAAVPADDRAVLTAVNQGVPLVAKLKSRSPGRELVLLAEAVRKSVESEGDEEDTEEKPTERSKSGLRALFGGSG